MLPRLMLVFVLLLSVSGFISGSGRVHGMQWRRGDKAVHAAVAGLHDVYPLTLVFDLLAPDGDESWMPYLCCRVVHLDADGNRDDLSVMEYIDGINVSEIGYGDASAPGLTTVVYRNYRVTVPPDGLKIKMSGNYELEVYESGIDDQVILSVPFAIQEGSVTVEGSVTSRADTDWNGSSQQLEISLADAGLDRRVAMQDVWVVIDRNGIDNGSRRTLLHPTRIVGNMAARYSHRPELVFNGGNEYRRMETVSTTVAGLHVAEITWDGSNYHHRLITDIPRRGLAYEYDQTQRGLFTVREADNSTQVPADTEADYTIVDFSLAESGVCPPDTVAVDVAGSVVGMDYDAADGMWRKSILLKQGAYDYRYLVDNGTDEGIEPGYLEGDHHQTQNVYTVRVYYRMPGERSDRLAGYGELMVEANK